MKSIIKIIIILFFLILGMQVVFGLGISPASKIIKYKPDLEEWFTLMIVNNENKSMSVEISKQGDLIDYITLSKDMIEFSAGEESKSFNVSILLPDRLEKPGDYVTEIGITEVPKERKVDYTGVRAKLVVASQLIVRVPYIGKHAKAELRLGTVKGNIHIFIPISNIGTEDIVAKAKISVLDQDKVLDEIDTKSVGIKSLEKDGLSADWSAPSIGVYRVLAEIYYDDKVIELEGKVDVGEVFMKVVDVSFDKIRAGEIAQLEIVAKSGWNNIIKDVYADVFVKMKDGGYVAELKSDSRDIDAFGEERLLAYWNTKGVKAGVYDLIVKLNYAGKITEKSVEVNVEEKWITPAKVEKEVPRLRGLIVIGVLVIILLVVVVIWLYRKIGKRKKFWRFFKWFK